MGREGNLTRLMLPMASPGLLTVALIVGLHPWNEFLIASTFLQAEERHTAVVAFFLLSGQFSSDWSQIIMAAALIIVLPIVVLFVTPQRRFIEGMAGGSVKGSGTNVRGPSHKELRPKSRRLIANGLLRFESFDNELRSHKLQ